MTEAPQTPEPTPAAPAAPAPAASASAPAAPAATAQPAASEKPVRPDFLPETFWDEETGFKTDDFNALLARDAENNAHLAQVPESADKYEAKLPEDFQLPEGFKLPEGESVIDPNDPRIAAARDFAHSRKLSQGDFENLIAMGVSFDLNEQTRLQEAMTQQVEALGAKGKERVGAVKTWISAMLPAKQAEAILGVLYTKDQIEGFEALMRKNRGAVPGNPGAGRDGQTPPGQIDGYENMTFRQRMAAIDRQKAER